MILLFEIDDEQKTIDLPLAVSEIRFSAFADFKQLENEYWELNESEDANDTRPLAKLEEAIKVLVKGDVDCLPFALPDDSYADLVERNYQIEIGEELSQLRIYAHLVVLISNYKPATIPEFFKWNWRGKKYILKPGPAARVIDNKPLSTGEVIECLEYQRRAGVTVENNPSHEGNIDFTLGLTEIAILLKQKGEKLPTKRDELTRFLDQRRKVFENITLDKLMELRFFLLNALVRLRQIQTTNSFGMDLRAKREQKNLITRLSGKKLQGLLGQLRAGVSSTKSE